jgi:DNA-binding XRE family transcriptional regulator
VSAEDTPAAQADSAAGARAALRAHRIRANLSVEETARLCGVHAWTLYSMERGGRKYIQPMTRARLIRFYPADLIDEACPQTPSAKDRVLSTTAVRARLRDLCVRFSPDKPTSTLDGLIAEINVLRARLR